MYTLSVDVTLAPDMFNPHFIIIVILPEDRNKCGDFKQNYCDNPERFNSCFCALGKLGFSTGSSNYEVQVRGKTMWGLRSNLSVHYQEVKDYSPENGY